MGRVASLSFLFVGRLAAGAQVPTFFIQIKKGCLASPTGEIIERKMEPTGPESIFYSLRGSPSFKYVYHIAIECVLKNIYFRFPFLLLVALCMACAGHLNSESRSIFLVL